MKNNKKLIIIGIIVIVAISISGVLFFALNSVDRNINKVKILLEENNYNKAYDIIKDKKLLQKENKKTNNIIKEKLEKYNKINLEQFLKLSVNDWNNVNSFNEMLKKLNLIDKYNYLSNLLEIKNEYQEYIPAISWYNSKDYETFDAYLEVEELEDFPKSANLMKDYSFEKYGLESAYIKDLNEQTQKYIEYCEQLGNGLKTNNNSLTLKAIDNLSDNENEMYYTKLEIIDKSADLENELNILQ